MIDILDGEDWVEIWVDNVSFHHGHEIPIFIVVDLLKKLGHAVSVTPLPDFTFDNPIATEDVIDAFRKERIDKTNA